MEWVLLLYLDNIMIKFSEFLTEVEKADARKDATAKRLGVDVSTLRSISDHDLHVLLSRLGKHDSVPDSKFCPKNLKMGIKIEGEHTKSRLLAKLIAKDHLVEIPDYYERLVKMEKEANKNRDRHDSDFL
jgi:hypothetical protein